MYYTLIYIHTYVRTHTHCPYTYSRVHRYRDPGLEGNSFVHKSHEWLRAIFSRRNKMFFLPAFFLCLIGRLVKLEKVRPLCFGSNDFGISVSLSDVRTGIHSEGSRAIGMSSRTAVVFRFERRIIYNAFSSLATARCSRVPLPAVSPCSTDRASLMFPNRWRDAGKTFFTIIWRTIVSSRDVGDDRSETRNRFRSGREIEFRKTKSLSLPIAGNDSLGRPTVLLFARFTGDPWHTAATFPGTADFRSHDPRTVRALAFTCKKSFFKRLTSGPMSRTVANEWLPLDDVRRR